MTGNEPGESSSATAPPSLPRTLTLQLYVSHFLSTWNARSFEFAATLFLAAIFPGTLLPVSIYAVARGAIAMLMAQSIGNWIDHRGRLTVVRISIIGQRVAVIGSCLLFWYMGRVLSRTTRNGLFGLAVVLACVEKVCSTMNMISIERDWVVVITQENECLRRTLNARMRRIDLFCKLLGPLTISFIAVASNATAIWATVSVNSVSVAIEYFAIQNVFRKVPALGQRTEEPRQPESANGPRTLFGWLQRAVGSSLSFSALAYYFKHPAFLPSFSLSLLYLTVLSFSGQMITYLIFVGYTSLYVGLARAISTVFELSATWIAPRLAKRIGTVRGGLWSIYWQMCWLAGGTAWFLTGIQRYGPTSFIPATGLAVGVVLSRVGLWGYDLCAQNIVQDEVEFGHRGSFSTSEAAFQNLFEILAYSTTIAFSRPDQFHWPVVISVGAVYVAGALYSCFVRKRRRHFFHIADFMGRKRESLTRGAS